MDQKGRKGVERRRIGWGGWMKGDEGGRGRGRGEGGGGRGKGKGGEEKEGRGGE